MNWQSLLLAIALLVVGVAPAHAARTWSAQHSHSKPRLTVQPNYYVEFLARPSQYFGHSYVRIGSISPSGASHPAATAGFYPKQPKTVFNAPGIITATRTDVRAKPSARYRLAVSERTFHKVSKLLAALPKTWTRYDLVGHNCNHLIALVARQIGLSTPTDYADLPINYVHALQAGNTGRTRASWR